MASGTYENILMHGPSIYIDSHEGDGKPNIRFSVRYNLTANSYGVSGTMDLVLDESQVIPGTSSYYKFGYTIIGYVGIEQADGTVDWHEAFTKPASVQSWNYGTYNGMNISVSSNKTGYVKLYIDMWSNCLCRVDSYDDGYEYFVNFATPNITPEVSYSVPSTPTLSANYSIVRNGTVVRFTYSKDNNYTAGTDYLQRSLNKTTLISPDINDSGSGYFDYTVSPGAGSYINMYARRYLMELGSNGYSSWSGVVRVNTYSDPTVVISTSSPADIVNGNTQTTINWNSWTGAHNETSTCSVYLVTSNSSSATTIATLATGLSYTTNSYTFNPGSISNMRSLYDNKTIYIKVTRTHSVTGVTGTGYRSLVVRFVPTSKITGLTSAPGSITSSKSISWSYPTGYNGIVNGYKIVLHPHGSSSTSNDIVRYTSVAQFTINPSDLSTSVSYDISISAYYDTNGVGPAYTVENYVTFIASQNKPVISYPLGGYWPKITTISIPSIKIVFNMPYDPNYPSIGSSYRYQDIEVAFVTSSITETFTLSEYPEAFSVNKSNLTHQKKVVFDPSLSEGRGSFYLPQSVFSIKIRTKSHSGTWSDYSDPIQINRFDLINFSPSVGDKVTAYDANTIRMYCSFLNQTITGYPPVIESVSSGDIVYKSYFDGLHNKLLEIYNVTSSIQMDNDIGFKIPNHQSKYGTAKETKITTNGYISYLYGMIKELCNLK